MKRPTIKTAPPVERGLPPPLILALLYFSSIFVGALLLWMPMSHTGAVGFGDAFFTSASAVTVTGLAVVDTGSDLTVIGQVILALLIQLGGLGLMAFAVLLLSALGLPVGLPQRLVLTRRSQPAFPWRAGDHRADNHAGGIGVRTGRSRNFVFVFVPD